MNTQFGNNNGSNGYLSIESFLDTLPSFKDFRRNELKEFSHIIYVRWFKKNEPIFYENEPEIGLYFIHEGLVEISKNSNLNGDVQTTTLLKGDFFGELSLIDDQLRTTNAVAIEDCCLISIYRSELLHLINRKPRLGNKILLKLNQLITERFQQQSDELIQIKEKLSNANFIL